MKLAATRAVLLRRRGLLFVEGGGAATVPEDHLKALEIEWAALGHVPSTRLRARLAELSLAELGELHRWVCSVLARQLGADRVHEPLFRSFPDGIPGDTEALWWRKVLSHFLQEIDQPCLFCGAVGTTHVLDPCLHVVCDRCFDGASYSACPVCEHAVDRASPFFRPAPERKPSAGENVTFKRLDLGGDPEAETRALFTSFCDRKQAMSPSDRRDLETIVLDLGATILGWLPEKIPVKENVALVFGTLFTAVDPAVVLPVAQRYLQTATDVLRFLAVLSGADASLLPRTRSRLVGRAYVQQKIHRFPMARLGRPLRCALLALMEGMGEEDLTEDMLRHRSFWVWAGEFLHPHEYARRFPKVARAFQVVRKFAPDGTRAPAFAGFKARIEAAAQRRDAPAMVRLLRDRPGELGRRLDHVLRIAGKDERAVEEAVHAFTRVAPRLSTPLLLTLYRFLPARLGPVARRVYWPKGAVTTGFSAPDERAPLTADAVGAAMAAVTAELLRRFGDKPALDTVVIDEALRQVMVPFNERTASRSAVALPRGSVVPVQREKIVRMFLHWCQPDRDGTWTDIDLSVGFYTDTWQEAGVCSYYQLKLQDQRGRTIATSGGDLRNAPFPDGASELVDVDWSRALAAGARYAVMVVNNYAGLPFSLLERGFAGLMLRDDAGGLHFDPRTVELKFDMQGENGVYMPLVLDLREGVLHWLDVYAQGQLVFNNVATSRRAITSICPTLMQYFASGIRPSMYDLALLHAASRAGTVLVRGKTVQRFRRREGEEVAAFHARLGRGEGGEATALALGEGRTLAALYRGDVDLPDGVERYVLFPAQVTATMSASDLVS